MGDIRRRYRAPGMRQAAQAFAITLLGGAVLAGSAVAQDRGSGAGSADRQDGYHTYSSQAERRAWEGTLFDNLGRDAFDRGYRAGREAERQRGSSRGGSASGAPGYSSGPAWNDAEQREAMERLERAAADLRHALVLMQRHQSGPRGGRALDQARQALIRTQNAMTWLPREAGRQDDSNEGRYERRSGRSIGPERASGGWEG